MTVSETLKQEAWSQQSNLPLVLLEIDHEDLAVPIRVVNDNQAITSNGEEYVAFKFEVILPSSQDDGPPQARLRIDNVSREIGEAIRTISGPPTVTMRVIRRETPDIIEAEFDGMVLRKADYDVFTVDGNLDFEDLTREPYPAHTFNPANYPGIL